MRMSTVIAWLMSVYRSVPLSCVCHDSFIYMICLPWLDDSWLMSRSAPSILKRQCVMLHIPMSHMNKVWISQWVMPHVPRSHMNHIWIHTPICHATHTNESFEWHMNKSVSHVTHTKESVKRDCILWLDDSWLYPGLRPLRVCGMTHLYVWHGTFICVTWHIHMCGMISCAMTHSYVWCDLFFDVTWLIYMRDVTHLYIWRLCPSWVMWMCQCIMRMRQWVMSHTWRSNMNTSTIHVTENKERVIWMSRRVMYQTHKSLIIQARTMWWVDESVECLYLYLFV